MNQAKLHSLRKKLYYSECREKVGLPFQQFFETIMQMIDPEFIAVSSGGGDLKSDGLLRDRATVYSVYSPEQVKRSKKAALINKFKSDFQGSKEKWPDMKRWIFVYNGRDWPAEIKMLVKKYSNGICVEIWNQERLWQEFSGKLTDQQWIELLGPEIGDETDKVVESVSSIELGELKGIHKLKDDASKRKMILQAISSPDAEVVQYVLSILEKMLPSDYHIISEIIRRLETWDDKTVETALTQYLSKCEDNRIPDVAYDVAMDPSRDQQGPSKPFRNVYFSILGKVGRYNQIPKLRQAFEYEQIGVIKGYIRRTIKDIQQRFPDRRPKIL